MVEAGGAFQNDVQEFWNGVIFTVQNDVLKYETPTSVPVRSISSNGVCWNRCVTFVLAHKRYAASLPGDAPFGSTCRAARGAVTSG